MYLQKTKFVKDTTCITETSYDDLYETLSDQQENINQMKKQLYLSTNIVGNSKLDLAYIVINPYTTEDIDAMILNYSQSKSLTDYQKLLLDPKEYIPPKLSLQTNTSLLTSNDIKCSLNKAIELYINRKLKSYKKEKTNIFNDSWFQQQMDQQQFQKIQFIPKKTCIKGSNLIRIDCYSSQKNNIAKSRKHLNNLCDRSLAQEVQYLYTKHGLSKKKIHFVKVNKILKLKSIDTIVNANHFKNQYKFKKIHSRARLCIDKIIEESSFPLQSSYIQRELLKQVGLRISTKTLRSYLKIQKNLVYKCIKPITERHNLIASKLQRQLSSYWYIEYLSKGYTILNIDESSICSTDQRRRGWILKYKHNFNSHSQRLSNVNIIAAIESNGKLYYTINQGKNNSFTFQLFLVRLCQQLDEQNNKWRENTLIILDNATYHRSKQVKNSQICQKFLPYIWGRTILKWPLQNYFFLIQKTEIQIHINLIQTLSKIFKKIQLLTTSDRRDKELLIKQLANQINKLEFQWIYDSFTYLITNAIECISMKNY